MEDKPTHAQATASANKKKTRPFYQTKEKLEEVAKEVVMIFPALQNRTRQRKSTRFYRWYGNQKKEKKTPKTKKVNQIVHKKKGPGWREKAITILGMDRFLLASNTCSVVEEAVMGGYNSIVARIGRIVRVVCIGRRRSSRGSQYSRRWQSCAIGSGRRVWCRARWWGGHSWRSCCLGMVVVRRSALRLGLARLGQAVR